MKFLAAKAEGWFGAKLKRRGIPPDNLEWQICLAPTGPRSLIPDP